MLNPLGNGKVNDSGLKQEAISARSSSLQPTTGSSLELSEEDSSEELSLDDSSEELSLEDSDELSLVEDSSEELSLEDSPEDSLVLVDSLVLLDSLEEVLSEVDSEDGVSLEEVLSLLDESLELLSLEFDPPQDASNSIAASPIINLDFFIKNSSARNYIDTLCVFKRQKMVLTKSLRHIFFPPNKDVKI